jgi:hypothetical protein
VCVCVGQGHTKPNTWKSGNGIGDGGGLLRSASSVGETVRKNLFEAKLKECLAAGPKSKLMSKARYDQTIHDRDEFQFLG